jgi:uncharacterized membrane protein (UPF0182 family)
MAGASVSPAVRVTEFVVFCLPFIKILVVIGILVAATIYLLRARPIRRWVRVCMRIGGGILVLPLVICMALLVAMAACTSRPQIIVSPDSMHIAAYSYEAGFLGRDSTFVSVRKKWSLLPVDAYSYAGPSDWSSTEVRWLDNEHLLIRYQKDDRDRPQHCRNDNVAGIFVQCVAESRK